MTSVLVVDDELELNKSICSFLESFDIKTNSATNKFDTDRELNITESAERYLDWI